MGLAHRALEFKGWFIKSTTLVCNTVGSTSIPSRG